jgi:hypothetical protein
MVILTKFLCWIHAAVVVKTISAKSFAISSVEFGLDESSAAVFMLSIFSGDSSHDETVCAMTSGSLLY